jgi:hypothetical protein
MKCFSRFSSEGASFADSLLHRVKCAFGAPASPRARRRPASISAASRLSQGKTDALNLRIPNSSHKELKEVRLRRSNIILSVCLIILFSMVPSGAIGQVREATVNTACSPIAYRPKTAFLSWDEDTLYTRKRFPADVGDRLYYVGDILRINSKDFQSIVREMNAAPSNIRHITFDAREIQIEGPISLTSAKLEFYADKIIFSREGRISLTAPPFADQSDGVVLISRTIEFDHALPVPIQLVISSKIPRSVKIIAEVVINNGKVVPDSTSSQYVTRKTLSGAYELGDLNSSNWTATTGKAASPLFMKAFREQMSWPRYTVTKLLKFHSRDPYSEKNIGDLRKRITALNDLIHSWSSPDAILDLDRLASMMRAHVDEFGNGPSYAPRVALSNQIDSLTKRIKGESDYLKELQTLIVTAYDRTSFSQVQVDEINKKIADTSTSIASSDAQMADLKNQQGRAASDFVKLKRLIEIKQSDIKRQVLEDADKAKKAEDIQKGVQLGSVAIGVGASLIAGPEVGAAAATGGRVFGGFVYANNTGGVTLTSVSTTLQDGAQFYGQMKSVFDSWSKYKEAQQTGVKVLIDGQKVEIEDPPGSGKKKVMGKDEAARAWGSQLKTMYDAFYALFDKAKAEKPTPLNLSDAEKLDPGLADLLSKLADQQKKESELVDKVQQVLSSQTTLKETQQRQLGLLKQLVDVKPVNDAEYERWRAAGLALWQEEVSRVVHDSYVLRRAYFYATGGDIVLPREAADYFDELQAAMMTGIRDPLLEVDQDDTAVQVGAKLDLERTKLTAVLTATTTAADDGLRDYLSDRGKQPLPFRENYELSSESGDPQAQGFIAAINAQIQMQVAGNRTVDHMTALPIPVSYRIRPKKGPERLVTITITSVVLEDSTDSVDQSGLTFYLNHPGYGTISWENGTCSVVDMRVPTADVSQTYTVSATAINSEWMKNSPTRIDVLDRSSFYTYFPLHTDLLLWVQADKAGHKWTVLPQLKSISIGIEVLQ